MAAATYHLNTHAQKLGKCIDKARPFYDVLREMRKVGWKMQNVFKIAHDDLISFPSSKCPFVISNLLINIPILINVIFQYSKCSLFTKMTIKRLIK